MENQNILEITKRRYRCDQCSKSHFKCDKLLPKCSKCTKRNIECTLDRNLVYNKKDKAECEVETKVFHIKFRNVSNANFKAKVTSKVNLIPAKENVSTSESFELNGAKHQLIKLPKDYNFSYNILGIFNKFKRKILLENLLNFIQNPSPFFPSKGLNLFIILTDKLGLLISKPKKLAFIPEIPNEATFNIGPILKQAIVNYFKFVNTTFPLFDETRFNFLSCPFNLKSAILVGGLFHMEQTETVKNLIKYFEGKLYNLLSNILKIKPKLENIQIILILISGITCFQWLNNLKESLLFYCYRISFIIGLNQSSKKLSKNTNIERLYTYCILNSYHNGTLLTAGSYIAEPTLPLELKKLDSYYVSKFSNHSFDFNKEDKDIQRYCFLRLQGFYYIISTLFFDLRLIKEKKIKETQDHVKFNNLLKRLSFKLFLVKDKYTAVMDDILPFVDNQTLKATIKDYQDCINYFFHHINFWVYSIQFNVSKERKIYEHEEFEGSKIINKKVSDYVKTILNQCYSVIDSAIIIPHRYTLTLDCPLISTCLVFMVRYGRNDNKTIMYIKKGKELLESLLIIPSAMEMCRFNLKLIEIIHASLKSPM
ncbi:hypothetical protein K502DRAFT_368536 [Neoconidiobolus thromboides FSU 785]|nr:hypothetical protein K502DRAFT_368536 [Neoconidiobolus thromboides FSU 785]